MTTHNFGIYMASIRGEKRAFPISKVLLLFAFHFRSSIWKWPLSSICAPLLIFPISVSERGEAVNIRAIMSPPLHSLWLIGTYKGEIWKHLCSYKCLFKSDKYLPGWTFQLRRIFCWLAAQETIFSTRWDHHKSSGSGVKCTTIPPLGFKYSVQKLHWLIMYVFLFLYQVSQLTESMRGDEQVIFWSLIWIVISSQIKGVPKMFTKYYQTSHQKS